MTKKQYEDEVERLAPSLRRIAYSIVRNEHERAGRSAAGAPCRLGTAGVRGICAA